MMLQGCVVIINIFNMLECEEKKRYEFNLILNKKPIKM